MSFMVLFGLFFLVSLQPIFMVSILILITFLYCYVFYSVLGTFWFSYILLMVMLSGVLVVFTYMITLIPNESFEIYSFVIFFFMMILLMMSWVEFYSVDFSIVSVSLWNSCFSMVTLFLVVFLLSVMLMVMSLSYVSDGAFRIDCLSAWVKG